MCPCIAGPGEHSVEHPQRTPRKRPALNICRNRRQVPAKGELLGWPKSSLRFFLYHLLENPDGIFDPTQQNCVSGVKEITSPSCWAQPLAGQGAGEGQEKEKWSQKRERKDMYLLPPKLALFSLLVPKPQARPQMGRNTC